MRFVRGLTGGAGPFALAVLLTLLTMLLALLWTRPADTGAGTYSLELITYWYGGFWDLLAFSTQMMLILILGHVLALSPLADLLMQHSLSLVRSNASAVVVVAFSAMVTGLLNWGIGLIFGAVLARRMRDHAAEKQIPIHYPLLGAAGYTGMMVWHGGFSGSAPLVIAQKGHFLEDKIGIIPISETILSLSNILIALALLTLIPLALFFIGKKIRKTVPAKHAADIRLIPSAVPSAFAIGFGLLLCGAAILQLVQGPAESPLARVNLNFVNLLLFGLAIVLMGNFRRFLWGIDQAIPGAAGILIQFPLYAGIMGIMESSGLLAHISDVFVEISTPDTFPFLTFISASLVNLFVPSGGGQWAVQGPLIAEAAQTLGVSYPKAVMAMAYGDQATNMIQPFWAIPLLAITGLEAKEILPYCTLIMLMGLVIFGVGVLV